MTRRRLVLAACIAVVGLGAVWWLYGDGLSAEERRLVGTWPRGSGKPGDNVARWELSANRRWHALFAVPPAGWSGELDGRWSIRDGKIYIDQESNAVRRVVRPWARLLRVDVKSLTASPLKSVTDDEFVIVDALGTQYTWTRDHGD
jgi:hypothetical protein